MASSLPRRSSTTDLAPNPACKRTLASLVRSAPAGSVVKVPPCIYREDVKITKPLTLIGSPGAEVRGSDVWGSWSLGQAGWTSAQTVPKFHTGPWVCKERSESCRWPEEVFFDGAPLAQIADNGLPRTRQFSLDASRHVILGDNPAGHVVEVVTREELLWIGADDVTVERMSFRQAAAPPGSGGVQVGGYWVGPVDRFTLAYSTVADVHGDDISIQGGSGHRIIHDNISHGGRTGISGDGGADWLIAYNRIHHNAIAGFDVGNDASGMKLVHTTGLRVEGNEIDHNLARGAWTDTGTRDATFRGNRIHDNTYNGLFLESSHGLIVEQNVVWRNALTAAARPWGWGGGITLASSDHADVSGNVVAWNGQGITVVSQERSDDAAHVGIAVHDNAIIQGNGDFGLAWMMDWNGVLFDPAAGNRGSNNRYWFPTGKGLFAWDGDFSSLSRFNRSPGEEGGRLLSLRSRDAILAQSRIP